MSKRLGQHFLGNKEKIKEIVDSLELKEGDLVIEIGAGHGELTRELVSVPGVTIVAIEKDSELVSSIEYLVSSNENLEIIQGDVLKALPVLHAKHQIPNTKYKVVGNIPYYITGKLLRILGELKPKPELIVLTVQKEVAERIVAEPPKMNLLAASVQFWANPEIIGFVPKKDFKPEPEVDSAIIKLATRVQPLANSDTKNYYKLVRALFKQPRKTILNNLQAGVKLNKDEITRKLRESGVNPADRPQNVDVADIQKLTRILYN